MYNQATLQLLERKEHNSYGYKIKRIQKQEDFKRSNIERFSELTKREIEITVLVANGFNNPQIAEMLFINRFIVEQRRKHINRKLGIKNFVQLFQYATAFDLT